MTDANFFDCYARLPGACEAYGQAITDIWWVIAFLALPTLILVGFFWGVVYSNRSFYKDN